MVHPAAGHWTGTLVNALVAHCGESLSGIGGERRPGIVHRLDKDTTGLMVVAKNDRAHKTLAAQFAGHGRDGGPFERGYLAFVWGAPDRPRGTVDRPIDRHKIARDRMAVREGGREAVTHWAVLERYGVQKGAKRAGGGRPSEPVASLLACIWPRLAIRSLAMTPMGRGFAPRPPFCPLRPRPRSKPLAGKPFMPIY